MFNAKIINLQKYYNLKCITKSYYNKMSLMVFIVLLFIFFISIELISTFYSDLFFYTVYFLISFTFFIVAVYFLYTLIKIWWKKDFTIFTKIVNSLSYGVIFAMYFYIFYVFGTVGFILFLLGKVLVYSYVEKTTLIIKQETNTYEQCLVAMLASAVNFLAYTLFLFVGEKQFSIIFIFFVKIVLLLLLMISVYFFVIEFKKWYTWMDIVEFCKIYPGHAVTLLFYFVRMVSIVVGEVVCMRYGIPGGLLMMGGPGIISTKSDTPEEQLTMFGKARIPVVTQTEELPPLPETPPQNIVEFTKTVANHAVELNSSTLYDRYKEQFYIFQERNEIFRKRFPGNWDEFRSCSLGMILDATQEGTVNYNMMITNQQPFDYLDSRGDRIQSKTMAQVTGEFIQEELQKQRTAESIMKENVIYHLFHKGAKGDMTFLKQQVSPYVLKNNVILTDLRKTTKVTSQQAHDVIFYGTYNKTYVRKCNSLFKNGGWQECSPYMAQMLQKVKRGR